MTPKLNTLFTAAVLVGIATATAVFAQEGAPAPQPPHVQGMMGDEGGMTKMMGQMSPDQMKRMTEMMDKCNHVMESMSNAPSGPNQQRAPATKG
jgi:Spy/CpxP family protein refolding chaperone